MFTQAPQKTQQFAKRGLTVKYPFNSETLCLPEHAEIDKSLFSSKGMFTIKTCLTWLLCYKELNVYSRLLCCFVPPTPNFTKLQYCGEFNACGHWRSPPTNFFLSSVFICITVVGRASFSTAVEFSTATVNSDVSSPNIQNTDACRVNCFAFFAEQVKIY